MLVQLWVHEASRIFYDRLADTKDRNWFLEKVQENIKNNLEFEWETDMLKSFLFGIYISNYIINKFNIKSYI